MRTRGESLGTRLTTVTHDKCSLRMRAPRVNYVPVGVKYQMHNDVSNYTGGP